jgi:uncharacterized caspase-like protein
MRSRGWVPSVLCLLVMLAAGCALDVPYAKYAIVYGISDYEGTLNDLQWADADAIKMAEMLTGQDYQVWIKTDSQSVVETAEEHASKTNLLSDIAAVKLAGAKEDDLFLFFFSGHGGQAGTGAESAGGDSQNEWIYLYGSVEPLNLAATFNDDELVSALAAIPCRRKVVILDSCNSGGFIGNALEADGTPPSLAEGGQSLTSTLADAISLYANFDGSSADIPPWEALVISASGEQESSYESPNQLGEGPDYKHGVFTYFLLQAEHNADHNRDGYITVTEAYYYVRNRINSEWSLNGAFSPHVSGGPVDYVLLEAR